MFQLHKIEDSEPNSILVELTYDLADGSLKRHKEGFVNISLAHAWTVRQFQKYLWEKLNRFVEHKYVLSMQSSAWCVEEKRPEKLHSLAVCLREVKAMQNYPADLICTVILNMETDLRNILPRPHQESYRSSLHNIDDLVMQADQHLKELKLRENKNKNHHEAN